MQPDIRLFLEALNPLQLCSEKEFNDYLYAKSLEIEPRAARSANVFPRKASEANSFMARPSFCF